MRTRRRGLAAPAPSADAPSHRPSPFRVPRVARSGAGGAVLARRLPLLVLVLVLLGGSYLRLAHLGRDSYGADELYQRFVAKALLAGEGPVLPSGAEYRRGLDVTRLVAVSMELLGPSQAAARLPTALFGVLNLILFAAVLWGLGGPWVAVWGTAFLAIDPETLSQSRHLRFYTYQLCFGLAALYTGWRALRNSAAPEPPARSEVVRQWLWAGLTVVLFALAARVQVVALTVAIGWGVCVALAALANLRARGWRHWRRNVPLQLTGLGVAGAALGLLLRPGAVLTLLRQSQQVDDFARPEADNVLAYYHTLNDAFPLLVSLAPLLFLLVGLRRPRLGVYLFTWFAVPVLLHSVALPWKGMRFILLAMPALFAAAALVAAWGAGLLYRRLASRLARAGRPGAARAVAGAAVAGLALWLLATMPAFSRARRAVALPKYGGWEAAAAIARARPELAAVPLGSFQSLRALHYFGRSDFSLIEANTAAAPGAAGYSPPLRRFQYTAVPQVAQPEIRARYAAAGAVLLVVPERLLPTLDPALRAALQSEAVELCAGRCEVIRLYHWRFAPAGPPRPIAPAGPVAARRR